MRYFSGLLQRDSQSKPVFLPIILLKCIVSLKAYMIQVNPKYIGLPPLYMMQAGCANSVIIVNNVSLDGCPMLEAEAIESFKLHICK